ncbi:MAG: M24 family metallopeptidase [Planctomycetota bacterium]
MLDDQTLAARRARAAEALRVREDLVLIGAGIPIPVPGGMDRLHPFRPHPHYIWLAGHGHAGGAIAYDPADNTWTDFVPPTTSAGRIWEGAADAPGEPLEGLRPWLAERAGRDAQTVAVLGCPIEGIDGDPDRAAELEQRLLDARRAKDEPELDAIRRACAATALGFEAARDAIALPHATERLIEIELAAACFRAGGTAMGYDTIVGVGGNAAVLHFSPGDRPVAPGDFVLIDAGCEVPIDPHDPTGAAYTADVSRTFVKGEPTTRHRELHSIVLEAERFGVSRCVPGQEWRELHLQVAVKLAEGLVELGILTGRPAGLVERDAHALFFPHGLGHLVGLGVRDASGYLPGRERSERFGLAALRMDLPLEAGFVTTVEPGLYFIPPLLRDPEIRGRYADAVNWDVVEPWIGIGGVRLEDDVLVTDDGPVNLTESIPIALEGCTVPA